jgi:hypothetical protein
MQGVQEVRRLLLLLVGGGGVRVQQQQQVGLGGEMGSGCEGGGGDLVWVVLLWQQIISVAAAAPPKFVVWHCSWVRRFVTRMLSTVECLLCCGDDVQLQAVSSRACLQGSLGALLCLRPRAVLHVCCFKACRFFCCSILVATVCTRLLSVLFSNIS